MKCIIQLLLPYRKALTGCNGFGSRTINQLGLEMLGRNLEEVRWLFEWFDGINFLKGSVTERGRKYSKESPTAKATVLCRPCFGASI